MRDWSAERTAELAGATLLRHGQPRAGSGPGPHGASIDTRRLAGGELFVGLAGERTDGGEHAGQALAAGAWGVLVTPGHGRALIDSGEAPDGAVLVHERPLAGLQALAGAWRRDLRERGAQVIAITGSTGKTSTKDILAALLSGSLATASSPQNMNTEIGLPLAVLAAPAGTQALVLEMAMRGPGQIAELAAIATPDVGVIVNVGPAHLELLGSLEAIAAAKAELIAGLAPGATAIVPAGEPLLRAHLREDLRTVTFGPGGNVSLLDRDERTGTVRIRAGETEIVLEPSFRQAHQLENLLGALAAARAVGVSPHGRLDVVFSAMRGQRQTLAGGIVLVDDCYNANPMSMRAALEDLAAGASGRRVAVLGDMLELGPRAGEFHRAAAEHAFARGVSLLVTVGSHAEEMAGAFAGEAVALGDAQAAAALVPTLLAGGDTVLVKGSRGVGLEAVSAALREVLAPLGERSAASPDTDTDTAASLASPGHR